MSQVEVQKAEKLKITLQTASLGLAAIGAVTAVANPLTADSAVITGVSVILGAILSKSDLQSRVTQSRFAYTTYDGILHQIKAILRSGNFDSDTEIVLITELTVLSRIAVHLSTICFRNMIVNIQQISTKKIVPIG